jgi:hypothetical protein
MYTHMKYKQMPYLSDKAKIDRLRMEIDDILTTQLTITREYLQSIWQDCFDAAQDEYTKESGFRYPYNEIGWNLVFELEVDSIL